MKASEIRKLSAAELDAAVKKDIARIKTVLRDIELHGTKA